MIYWRHGLAYETQKGIKRFLLKLAEKYSSVQARYTLCVSPSIFQKSREDKLTKPQKLLILGRGSCNGINMKKHSFFKKLNRKKISFGFIGRLSKDKGVEELIKAWELVKGKERSNLIIAGPIDDRDPISPSLLKIIKSQRNLIYLGTITNPADFYLKIDVLVLPSYREGLPTVVLEGSASKKAIITTKSTGCIDSIIEDHSGKYCDPTPESISKQMTYFLNNCHKIPEYGKNGRQFISRFYEERKKWNEISDFYKEILLNKN